MPPLKEEGEYLERSPHPNPPHQGGRNNKCLPPQGKGEISADPPQGKGEISASPLKEEGEKGDIRKIL